MIEPVTELGGRGALPLPRARVVPLSAPPSSNTAAVERHLTGAGIAKSSARIYRISLTTWGWMLAGEPAPTGPTRRGAKPPVFPVTTIDDPALPELLAEIAAGRADEMDADTVNRELSIARLGTQWQSRTGAWLVIVSSAQPHQQAKAGLFPDLLGQAVTAEPPPGTHPPTCRCPPWCSR
ncbi:hypothetical protein [Streptomyces sp. NBC_00151]|uniref:hypothetical protein n=1 Tax=Streptomyces sp. NBC_00151 TaxID=2975669 RepID=UPI002DD8E369|nr:hypothetical protein [Streptomyces sp. NBC_00151]WRZ44481.1 hypothetical protein OG915_44605 [Streptomyces sp. NBC_00151]